MARAPGEFEGIQAAKQTHKDPIRSRKDIARSADLKLQHGTFDILTPSRRHNIAAIPKQAMSGKPIAFLIAVLGWLSLGHAAFVSELTLQHVPTRDSSLEMKSSADLESRRTMLQDVALASFGLASGLVLQNQAAHASGGATAGGVYLLSAKQRYNERVVKGIKSFLALEPTLEGGSIEETKAYFTSEEVGAWKDASAAGYLLANAFRRSSATAPDNLPAVKKWKAFAKEVTAVEKSLRKKDTKVALAAFQSAESALDAYLDEVELPPAIEMRK